MVDFDLRPWPQIIENELAPKTQINIFALGIRGKWDVFVIVATINWKVYLKTWEEAGASSVRNFYQVNPNLDKILQSLLNLFA